MNSRMIYTVKLTCQGQNLETKEFYSLIKAVLYFAKLVREYGKHNTMRIDITAWMS